MNKPAALAADSARQYWRSVRRAPGTHLWLVLLLASTEVVQHVKPPTAQRILELHSTNLHYLAHDPIRVLITSTWYLAGGSWLTYFVLYTLFHAPAEHWLGTRRWLAVVLITHIGATYLSEGVLDRAIHLGLAPQNAAHTLDYGVSYALAGVQAVLTYRIPKPWRYPYAAAVLLLYGIALAASHDFTSIGHFDAALLGFACYPLTHRRPSPLDRPAEGAPAIPETDDITLSDHRQGPEQTCDRRSGVLTVKLRT